MNLSAVNEIKATLTDRLSSVFGVSVENATTTQLFCACAVLEREAISRMTARESHNDERQLHYLSMEFLMGRSLEKNAFNLGILDELKQALTELGADPEEVIDTEPDAGLGNGGLGRLAACYMDSLATLGKNAVGYSLCYELGMFRQKIENGKQVEVTDDWTLSAESWLVPCYDDEVEVTFGGRVKENWDYNGKCTATIVGSTTVQAVPRDMLICGFRSDRVNVLRLWEAKSPHALDLKLFSGGEYVKSLEERTMAEVITKILYPADDHIEGKKLRIRQQYFFVSATAQSVVKKHREKFGDVRCFAQHHVFQINDTHPTMVIPELLRIFMDEDGLGWDEALGIVRNCVAYTNHTVMSEALEVWPQDIIESQLPRIWQIIRELDSRYRRYLSEAFHGDKQAIGRNLIISDGLVHMANICLAVCFKINGVSRLHTDILRRELFRDVYEQNHDRFINVTNGIDHRRWLSQINPELNTLVCQLLGGDQYFTKPELLSGLEAFVDDEAVLTRILEIKQSNKRRFADYIDRSFGVALNTDAIFDVQVKRLHEYKRQLLCAMLITHLQQRIHADPNAPFTPRTFIFGAKAASSYTVAKRIIELICSLSADVMHDPLCAGKLQVIFVENYRVSLAEKLMPAADVSEQISTAGKEASGTGNMKLMLNGAVTIGTLDGANVEMYERLGGDYMFLFGLRANQVESMKAEGYAPVRLVEKDPRLSGVLEKFNQGFSDGKSYSDIVSRLVYGGDEYMLLADFESYLETHDRLYERISDPMTRARTSLVNTARSGCFAADRAAAEYCENIWHI